ncbi:cystatin-like [Pelodytes ibericus]
MDILFKLSAVVILAAFAHCSPDQQSRQRRMGGWNDENAGTAVTKPKLLGGWSTADVKSEGVQNALDFATAEYNRQSNSELIFKVNRIVSAKKQVVAGMKYLIVVDVSLKPCTYSDNDHQICQNPENAKPEKKRCTFEILVQAWLDNTQLNRKDCKPRF